MHDEQVLVIRRLKDGRSYCVLPGGGVEESENLREASRREFRSDRARRRRGRAARRLRRQRCACGVLRGAADLHRCVTRRTGATPSIGLRRVRPQLGRRDLAR
ncbi:MULTISPECIES: NUDIX domain-containing protein [unclassified Curtobacterium]|uniref:NUDIX domain-containing protein n=1 Tax=unclassified Curtobacterium TaxID=257496 RepID=UPI0015E8E3BA